MHQLPLASPDALSGLGVRAQRLGVALLVDTVYSTFFSRFTLPCRAERESDTASDCERDVCVGGERFIDNQQVPEGQYAQRPVGQLFKGI
jgi:hypothetical protein